ncbi:MAG: hypothetical protein QM802_04700 [Agriterribacter sp.]
MDFPEVQIILDKISSITEKSAFNFPDDLKNNIPSQVKELIQLSRNIEAPPHIKDWIEQIGTYHFKNAENYLEEYNEAGNFEDIESNQVAVDIIKDDLRRALSFFNNFEKEIQDA